DTDNDGLSDSEEKDSGTDPTKDDTDEDGYSDLKEIEAGSNPLNANSVPPAPPIDEPLFFYDFEGDEGDLVTDKGQRGNNADVTRATQTELGVIGGAPQGSSPGTAIEFSDGLLNVPGVDMAEIISGNGSYTMSAWLKPSNLNANKFLFGQTNQGIHNGIRNGGFLHQAHWGADTNGATNLNGYLEADEDGWIHAAWTYDGETDTGKIYLDGSLDWEGNKRAPNGSGNLIIGGRSGGGDGYYGLADDIAMWDMVLEPEAIEELALGGSPIGANLPFQITSITYDLQSGEIELTWDSKPGRNYLLLYNTSLENWDADIDDSIESGGESTTYRFENPEGPEAKALFFKVIEN
ncbi:MAG: LamG-like jellyroll fold domain-containing protein, partial [Verrucomicrobiota bacterium]|nr:LamG-like jellyroll fold domain-containing protein [Verrucomicrobiota bacterium]